MDRPARAYEEGDVIPHRALFNAPLGGAPGQSGSKVFHIDDVPELASLHDTRKKRILLNRPNTGAPLLVDVVTIGPGDASPLHYHKGTDHFFLILDGRGRIVVKDQAYALRRGSVAWVADGDIHQLFADPDSPLTFMEYFSRGDHETVFVGQSCE